MSGQIDGIVQRAIEGLERVRENALASANFQFDEAKRQIETLQSASLKEGFFERALVVAVGDFPSLAPVRTGDSFYVNTNGGGASFTVSKSLRTEEEISKAREVYFKSNAKHGPPPLRALLIVWEDKPPLGDGT